MDSSETSIPQGPAESSVILQEREPVSEGDLAFLMGNPGVYK